MLFIFPSVNALNITVAEGGLVKKQEWHANEVVRANEAEAVEEHQAHLFANVWARKVELHVDAELLLLCKLYFGQIVSHVVVLQVFLHQRSLLRSSSNGVSCIFKFLRHFFRVYLLNHESKCFVQRCHLDLKGLKVGSLQLLQARDVNQALYFFHVDFDRKLCDEFFLFLIPFDLDAVLREG